MRKRVDAHVKMQKIVPNVNASYKALWENFPEDHESVGIISCDVEDVMYFALDDATKKARIHVIHVETVYGGVERAWSKFGGEITAIISGPKVEDVRNGLMYIKNYIENKCGVYVIDDDPTTSFYVDLMPRIGKWNQERLGLPADSSLAYLVATPIEATYGLDKALKASNTKIVEFFDAPSRVNTGGALLCGTESACKAAVEAFADAVEFCFVHPMSLDS